MERELAFLKATDVVIESGHRREDIRNDGWPKSNSTAQFSDIRLFFKCKHGDLRYECAEFDKWRANLRAIGLWMQRQRLALEEWGIGSGGEAYRGFAALPPGGGMQLAEFASVEAAARVILAHSDANMSAEQALGNDANLALAFRKAASRAHPDNGGDAATMAKLNRARDFIEKHRGVPA